tara:strand:- start:110 stop:2215 length:2106 start_codon:yes stop_codon:yes gene_type:complete
MAVSKNTIVITSNGPKGEKGSAVTVDGDAITSFSTIAITGDDSVVADQANDTVTFTGGENVSVSSSGSEVTIASNNTEYLLDTAQNGNDATITLTGTDASTDSITLAAGSGVTLTESGDTITIASTASGSAVTVQEDGVSLTTGVTTLNFTGDGVVLNEPQPDNITISISGDAGNKYLSFSDGTTSITPDDPADVLNVVAGGSSSVTVTASQVGATSTLTIDGGRLQDESAPALTAQLDVANQRIYTTTTNGNISIQPNGTGVVSLGSSSVNDSVNISSGLIEVRNNNAQSEIKLYCENDSHFVSLKAPVHADITTSYTLTLPGDDGDANQYLQTDGSGNLSWATVSGGSATTLNGQKLEYVVRDAALSSAGHYEGLVMKVGDAGNTLTAGTVYYFDATQTDWVAASNAAEATAKGILGIALGPSGTADGVLIQGVYYYADAAGATGDVLFLGTAGALTATAPTSDGEILRVLGQNIDDYVVMFNPSQDFVELGAAAGTTGLDDLSDVAITSPSNGHLLIYDSGDSQFENAELTAGANIRISNTAASITLAAGLGQELEMTTQTASDGAVNATGEAEGTIVKFGDDATTAGEVYTFASGTWTAVDANADTTTEGLLGLAIGGNSSTNGMLVHGIGFINHNNSANAGDPLYISATTAGDITATQPTAGGDFVRVVGYALDAGSGSGSKVFFSPSQDYIEIAT